MTKIFFHAECLKVRTGTYFVTKKALDLPNIPVKNLEVVYVEFQIFRIVLLNTYNSRIVPVQLTFESILLAFASFLNRPTLRMWFVWPLRYGAYLVQDSMYFIFCYVLNFIISQLTVWKWLIEKERSGLHLKCGTSFLHVSRYSCIEFYWPVFP